MERFFDVIFSSIALILLSPLLVVVVLLLRFSGEGEIFFYQDRIGMRGRVFKLYKFATMQKNSPNIGSGTVTMKDDPRILPLGRYLRKTKINELPQLLNILFGDMSIIGPRPMTLQTFSFYSVEIQEILNTVRPGLSGVGSIIFRNEEEIMHGTSASLDFYINSIAPYKGKLEQWFASNKGIRIYFLAIFITAWTLVFPSTKIAWTFFRDLPVPPSELKQSLNYND